MNIISYQTKYRKKTLTGSLFSSSALVSVSLVCDPADEEC